MVAQAIMLGLIAGIGILDGRIFGQMMFDRPLVTGLLVGVGFRRCKEWELSLGRNLN